MIHIPKFPRTFHLPFSPGRGSDDKVHINCKSFLNKEIIITEKMDGGNTGIDSCGVYARSRNGFANHPSFNMVKSWYSENKKLIDEENLLLYLENMYGVHSIEYNNLNKFMFLIDALKEKNDTLYFVSYDELIDISNKIKVLLVPDLFRGVVKSEKELEKLISNLMNSKSKYGDTKEGVVIRIIDEFHFSDYSSSTAKYVRANHVQSDIHWSKNWKRAKLKGAT